MCTIVEIQGREDGGHGIQSQSHRVSCWLEGWVAVPEELTERLWACGGYCDLILNEDGELVGLTERQRPAEPEPEPTETEQLRADVDYIAVMTGVEL